MHLPTHLVQKKNILGGGSSSVGKSSKFPNILCTFPLIGRDAWLLWLAGMLGSRKVWDMTAQRIQKSEFFLAAKAATLLHNSLRHAWQRIQKSEIFSAAKAFILLHNSLRYDSTENSEIWNLLTLQTVILLHIHITVLDMTAQRIQKSEICSAAKAAILLHKSLRYGNTENSEIRNFLSCQSC